MSRTVSIHLVERVDHTRILDVEDLRELAFGDSIAKHHDFVRQPIFMSPLPKTKTFDHELGETIYHLLFTLLQEESSRSTLATMATPLGALSRLLGEGWVTSSPITIVSSSMSARPFESSFQQVPPALPQNFKARFPTRARSLRPACGPCF